MDDVTSAIGSTAGGLMGLRHIDHLGIAVPSIAEAAALFVGMLGGRVTNGGDDPIMGIRTVQLTFEGGFRLELLEPLREDSGVARFLARRGPGFHHLTVMVRDIEAAIAELEGAGFELVDTDIESDPLWRATYVRPRSGFGILLQVVETPIDWSRQMAHVTLDRIVGGELTWVGQASQITGQPEG
jgi:methylmalonyl-CoA/ethylmalonyl-CoA epimerase